jgi:hypothetical protein
VRAEISRMVDFASLVQQQLRSDEDPPAACRLDLRCVQGGRGAAEVRCRGGVGSFSAVEGGPCPTLDDIQVDEPKEGRDEARELTRRGGSTFRNRLHFSSW